MLSADLTDTAPKCYCWDLSSKNENWFISHKFSRERNKYLSSGTIIKSKKKKKFIQMYFHCCDVYYSESVRK